MAKTDKTCIICGKIFQGTAKAQVCGATCRQRLKRGVKPTFKLVAKSTKKETKIQDLTKPSVIKSITENPATTNYTVDTRKPYMNDAIRKKLGL